MSRQRKIWMKYRIYGALIVTFAFISVAAAQVIDLTPGAGGIDWSEGVIRVSGVGHANPYTPPGRRIKTAEQNAKIDLKKNLQRLLKSIRWDAEYLISDLAMLDLQIDSNIVDLSKKISIIDIRYLANSNVEIDAQTLLKYVYQWYPPAIPDSLRHKHPPDSASLAVDDTLFSEFNWEAFGGIIIDARRLGTNPGLFPKIMDEAGHILFDVTVVKREFLHQYGMVGYVDTPEAAKVQKRISGKSLLIRAKNATGKYATDLVIGSAGARKIRAASQSSSLLREGRVVIMIE